MTEERNQRITAENREKDQNKRMQRQIRDMKEEMAELSKKEGEASRKKHELVRPWVLGDLKAGVYTRGDNPQFFCAVIHFTRKWTLRA